MRTRSSQAQAFWHGHSAGPQAWGITRLQRNMSCPLVNVKLAEGGFTEKQQGDMAAGLTDVTVDFEGSEAFYEVVWVLIEKLRRNRWPIGGQPFSIRQGVLKGQQRPYHRAHADQRQVRP